jgi:ureidoglycolate dehydrogenase (NAD+)
VSAPARQVSPGELGRFIRDSLVKHGARAQDAAIVAEGLVWANLRGGDGHGVSRLPRYLKFLDSGDIDVTAQPRLVHDRGATLMIDGGHGFGPVAVMEGAARAIERAKATGVCFALIRNTAHTGAIGRYAQWIAERGYAALLMGAGPTLMAYHGARVASMATSPIAIAVPSSRGLIALDMSSSTISNGKILQARAAGAALPAGTVLTAAGEPTTDARQAEILLPLGGPKGSGLAFMFEMLASVLAGAPIQAPALGPEKRTRHTGNTAMVVIDIETFRPLVDFQRDAEALARSVKTLPRQSGFDEILLPGERGSRTEAARRKTGIPIPAKLWEELAALAKVDGVKMPEQISIANAARAGQ